MSTYSKTCTLFSSKKADSCWRCIRVPCWRENVDIQGLRVQRGEAGQKWNRQMEMFRGRELSGLHHDQHHQPQY